jgi:hypoxanthine phosphoribosyltransferase
MPQEYITWEEFYKECNSAGTYINKPDIIIAIGRGGFVPATLLSHKLNIKDVYNIGLQSYDGQKSNEIKVIQDLDFNSFDTTESILIVDDISDKGNTLKYVVERFKQSGFKNIQTFTLYIKTGTKFIPDIYAKEFDQHTWVVFPWESKI